MQARLDWTPIAVGAVLVLPESTRLRAVLARPAEVLARMFPIDSRRVAAWLREPIGPLAATWFLRDITARNAARVSRRRGRLVGVESPAAAARLNAEAEPEEMLITILR